MPEPSTVVKTAQGSRAVAAIYVVLATPLGASRAPISTSIYAPVKAKTLRRLRLVRVLVRFQMALVMPQFLHRPAKNSWANVFPRTDLHACGQTLPT